MTTEDRLSREGYKNQYLSWLCLEEIHWKQKSHLTSLRYGDRNITFFHKVTNNWRKNNDVMGIRVDGNWITDLDQISQGITKFYRELFTEPFCERP